MEQELTQTHIPCDVRTALISCNIRKALPSDFTAHDANGNVVSRNALFLIAINSTSYAVRYYDSLEKSELQRFNEMLELGWIYLITGFNNDTQNLLSV